MSWNDERVEILRQLWTEGLSASQIAERLGGGLSRNAVIGKVHRLKLESRARALVGTGFGEAEVTEATIEAAAEAPAVVAAPVVQDNAEIRLVSSQVLPAARVLPRTLGATALKMEPIDAGSDDGIVGELEVAEARLGGGEVVPIARKLTLVQLSERTCKWPVGDPLKPDFHFCGHHAGDASPYCSYHARLAFQPSAERRRMR